MSVAETEVKNSIAKELMDLAQRKELDQLQTRLNTIVRTQQFQNENIYVLIHNASHSYLTDIDKDALTKTLLENEAKVSDYTAFVKIGDPLHSIGLLLGTSTPYKLLQRLIRCGINVSGNCFGSNALHWVFYDLKKVSLLLKHGCNINSLSSSGFGTPIHIIIANEYESHYFSIMDELERNNLQFDYTARDKGQRTILILAARMMKESIVKHILNNCPLKLSEYINLQDEDGCTALHRACGLGQINIINLLIKNGANIYITDNYGFTPFHYLKIDKESIEELLAEVEIDPDRHWRAQCNSFTTLVKKKRPGIILSSTILPESEMQTAGIIPSRFKNNGTQEVCQITGVNYQEMLICLKNTKMFNHYNFLVEGERSIEKMPKEQRDKYNNQVFDIMPEGEKEGLKMLVKLLEEQWAIMGNEDVSVSQQALNTQKHAKAIFLKEHPNSEIFEAFKEAYLQIQNCRGDKESIELLQSIFISSNPKILELGAQVKNPVFQQQCKDQFEALKKMALQVIAERTPQNILTFSNNRTVSDTADIPSINHTQKPSIDPLKP